MRKKATILIDMDDVLEDLLGAWVKALNEKFGTSVAPSDVVTWELEPYFPGLTRQDLYSVFRTPGFWLNLEPRPGAVDAVNKLLDLNYDVKIVTAATPESAFEKSEWLKKWLPRIPWEDVIITSNKQLIRGDVLIDDGVHNLIGGKYRKILVDRPHNQSFDCTAAGMLRVFRMSEVVDILENWYGDPIISVGEGEGGIF